MKEKKKKKLLYHSDFSLLKTGFARTARLILTHLYNTGKYDIVHYCCGVVEDNPNFDRLPWKSIGALPKDPEEQAKLNKDPKLAKMVSYGSLNIDQVVEQEKPDVYLAVQDIWGINYSVDKDWFSEITSAIWTTLDSLPILPMAVDTAKKTQNFWVWSDFANEALKEIGIDHVETVHGPLDENDFFKLPDDKKSELRQRFGLDKDSFVIGYVFRNQLRKSVPNLLKGYKLLRDQHPDGKFNLLLHTHFGEGWEIPKLCDELGVNKEEVLTTYFCKSCGTYYVAKFQGQDLNCLMCNAPSSLVTTSPSNGVSEDQLNEIYNMMDVYCHPFTSGGQEIPIQEAKLCEIPALVTNYSCGVDMCKKGSRTLPLDWHEFREHETQFIKASTDPKSIHSRLNHVYNLNKKKRRKIGREGRLWIIESYSISRIGKRIEEFIDSAPYSNESTFSKITKQREPDAEVDDSLPRIEWLKSLYSKVLGMKNVTDDDPGIKHWVEELNKGVPRERVSEYFRSIAVKEIKDNTKLLDYLDEEDGGKRILFVIPESAGDIYLCTSLFESLKEQYPKYNLYVACKPQYFDIIYGNPFVHKVIPYSSEMDDLLKMEGKGKKEGLFEIALLPFITTQRHMTYQHNGKDKIAFDLDLD